jgi:hypothetical protein
LGSCEPTTEGESEFDPFEPPPWISRRVLLSIPLKSGEYLVDGLPRIECRRGVVYFADGEPALSFCIISADLPPTQRDSRIAQCLGNAVLMPNFAASLARFPRDSVCEKES